MRPVLIIYFSGVGNTRAVAEYIRSITAKIPTEMYSVERLPDSFNIESYSAVIMGTPTYHSEPAQPLMSFLEKLTMGRNIPAFLFTTCGLYSENCLRILAKECIRHKLIPLHCASYRCSATDGMLLVPFMECWFKNEKDIQSKIRKDIGIFIRKLKSRSKPDIPSSKWYVYHRNLCCYRNQRFRTATRILKYMFVASQLLTSSACGNKFPQHIL